MNLAVQDSGKSTQQMAPAQDSESEEELVDVVPDGAYELLLGALRAEQGRNTQPHRLTESKAGRHSVQGISTAPWQLLDFSSPD